MKSIKLRTRVKLSLLLLLFAAYLWIPVSVQSQTPSKSKTQQPSKPSKASLDKLTIDSLNVVVGMLRNNLRGSDSSFKAERVVSADLREQILTLDDYRKKLEAKNTNFYDDNLKLNQSNRILIIFNSLVAILLVISLVFFVKRISRKKIETPAEPVAKKEEPPVVATRFASFEDRLIQLERLGKLREKGLLSEEEFVAEKTKILGK